MIKIVEIKGLKNDTELELLSNKQQQYVAVKIRKALSYLGIKAKVIVE